MEIRKEYKVDIELKLGDCLDVLKTIPDNSIDSVVTDPPYGLEFMGKEWDTFKQGRIAEYKEGGKIDLEQIESRKGKGGAGPSYTNRAAAKCRKCGKQRWSGSPCKCEEPDFEIDNSTQHTFQSFTEAWARECYRVLKPGGHLLAFGGSRMYHRLACGVEDAGFEIRDQIMWVYGSGFPKSHNIGKAIDANIKTGKSNPKSINQSEMSKTDGDVVTVIQPNNGILGEKREVIKNIGASLETEQAKNWEGWGTALKPAHEPIVMARKPLSEKSIAENVLKHGTGGINIDGSRIVTDEDTSRKKSPLKPNSISYVRKDEPLFGGEGHEAGRFPANIIFDEEAGQLLDEQSGVSKSGTGKKYEPQYKDTSEIYGKYDKLQVSSFNDKGGASRFFYCPKASKKDRDEGLDNFEEKSQRVTSGGTRDFNARCANCGKKFIGSPTTICDCDNPVTDNQVFKKKNNHPTVKPTDLMRYLINLITPPNGTILDPFMGSGSTGKAAVRCGVNFIGIEKEQEYMDIAKARIEHEKNKPVQTKLL
jgi:DNA modification methylase